MAHRVPMLHKAFQRSMIACLFFFFQAEDGIRDLTVTGVQTCALPIYSDSGCAIAASGRVCCAPGAAVKNAISQIAEASGSMRVIGMARISASTGTGQIGRAACRERV